MTSCKKTYDDVKRTESIIKGYIRGKYIEPTINESKIHSFGSTPLGIAKP